LPDYIGRREAIDLHSLKTKSLGKSTRTRSRKGPYRKQGRGEAQIVVFKLEGENYGIEIGQVREIIRKREITQVPRQPPYVEGVINVRGTIIPVVNLKKRFGFQGDASKYSHTIIVESVHGLVGMLVDAVSEVIRVYPDQIHSAPSMMTGTSYDYLQGICRLGDELLIYLDVSKVVKASTTFLDQEPILQGMPSQPSVTTD
jgi:purine-binding chemotaxis protein CheW